MSAGELFATCPVRGCRGPAEVEGEPCADCLRVFGAALQRAGDAPPLRPAVAAAQAADAQRVQTALDVAQHRIDQDTGLAPRLNQRCWVCEERRRCTKTRDGWECDTCRTTT